jgi:hypothetical protein
LASHVNRRRQANNIREQGLRKISGPKTKEETEDQKICIMRSFTIYTTHKIAVGDHTKDNETDGACGTYGRAQKCVQGFSGEN